MNVVVVESPAKAKTINKYLGSDFTVVASYGPVRDLPPKDGSVRPDEDFAMSWEADPRSEKQIRNIAAAVKGAAHLYLATDPDREGEAISWHVRNVLDERKALKGVDVKRVVFHEITKTAVLEAMRNPRELDQALVDAYLARRALDYLVGFTLSPVLWRKLPGSRSAGRVQSVALRLICEREAEIERFRAEEFWTVEAVFTTEGGKTFTARLVQLDGRKLEKFDLNDEASAQRAVEAILKAAFAVSEIDRKQVARHPQPPFTTSTLQQEASRKLGFSASRTMQLAQRLYEGVDIGGETVGLITYMRTDGVTLSQEAIASIRSAVAAEHGQRYVPAQPRQYKARAKNAQEAHEAIRPTDAARHPREVSRHIDSELARLYDLVWKRAVASQMASAQLDRTTVTVAAEDGRTQLRAVGSIVVFDGFLKLYEEDTDDAEAADEDRLLPPMREGEPLRRGDVKPEQHFTQPPPRFSEASLVKRMEELGIGRPSTYASIMQVLQDRNYVRLERRRFIPEDRGRLVTAFLANFFSRYVKYDFTADLEGELDEIAGGTLDWRQVLRDFWADFNGAIEGTKDLRIGQVLDALNEDLAPHFFQTGADGALDRKCPGCGEGTLSLKLGRFGAFIGCSGYPECRFTRQFAVPSQDGSGDAGGADELATGPKVLGQDPETGLEVSLRKGPYGTYVQLGEAEKGSKPKRVSLTKGMVPSEVTLAIALGLLSLPRPVGPHPDTGEPILAGIGRFGPYLKHETVYVSIPAGDDVLNIGLNRVVDLIASQGRKRQPAKSIGDHDGKPVTVHAGRYGPYVQHGQVRATLPKGVEADTLTLEQAIPLIVAKAGRAGGKTAAKPKTAKPKAAAKAAAKPKAAATDGATAKAAAKPKATAKAKATAKPKAKAAAKPRAAGSRTPGSGGG